MIRKILLLAQICFGIFVFLENANASSSNLIGHWEGTILKEGKSWQTWVDLDEEGTVLKGTADFPDYGLFCFQVDANLDGTKVKILVLEEGKEVANFEGTLKENEITGEWKGLNLAASFQLKRIRPLPDNPYIVEDVRFQNGTAILAGTLVRPNKSGQFPAVVFTHGSGNQTRSETFYRSRAYWFARNGIAALIYDRRGKGASKGDTVVTWNNLADDALAGLEMLRKHPAINPKQIGVSGFSQGGWVSPLAATRSENVAFVLVGSAAGISPNDQNNYNVESVLTAKGVSHESIKAVMELRKDVSDFEMEGVGDKQQLQKRISALKTERWFRDTLLNENIEQYDADSKAFMAYDPAPTWEKVKVPALSLWGEQDLAVPAKKSREIINRALETGKARTYDLREFPKAGHGLNLNRGEGEAWDFPRLVPGYSELMVKWIKKYISKRK